MREFEHLGFKSSEILASETSKDNPTEEHEVGYYPLLKKLPENRIFGRSDFNLLSSGLLTQTNWMVWCALVRNHRPWNLTRSAGAYIFAPARGLFTRRY